MPRIISSLPDEVSILSLLGPGAGHHEHGHEDINPHIWLDPVQTVVISENIRDALIQLDPLHKAQYQQNAAELKQRLLALDKQISSQLSSVSDRAFIVYHDAYTYLVERYGLQQVGIVTPDEHQLPGGKHLQILRKQLKEQTIPCLFTEPQFEPAIVENLVRGTSTRVQSLDPVGSDYASGPNAYFEMVRSHIDFGGRTLIEAAAFNFLGCAVVFDAAEYQAVLEYIGPTGGYTTLSFRREQAIKAFSFPEMQQDMISRYVSATDIEQIKESYEIVRALG